MTLRPSSPRHLARCAISPKRRVSRFHSRRLGDHLCSAHPLHQHNPSRHGAPGTGLCSRSFSGRMRGPAGTMPRTLLLAVRFSVPNVGKWCDNNGDDDFCVVRFSPSSPPVWVGLASLSESPSVNAAAYFCGPLVITCRLPSPSQAI
jgi:hypothetical protein